MPYADSDFFLALLKESDWLSRKAERCLAEYRGKIWTSRWALVEMLLLAKEYNLDPENVVLSATRLAKVAGTDELLSAAHLMKEKGMSTFDALHAVSCHGDKIISSDSIFDKLGLERIRLES